MEAPETIYVHEASAPELTEKLPYHLEYIRKDNLSECKTLKLIPSSSSIEEAAEEYAPDFSDSIASKAAVDAVRDAFKAGAQWQKKQIEKKRLIEY